MYNNQINEKYLELAQKLETDYKEYSRLGEKLDLDTYETTLDFGDFLDLCKQLNLPVIEEYNYRCPFGESIDHYARICYDDINEYIQKRKYDIEMATRHWNYDLDKSRSYSTNSDIASGEFTFFYFGRCFESYFNFVILEHIIFVRHRHIVTD